MAVREGLVSTDWLADHLGSPDVRVVDASWYLPAQGRDAKVEYAAAHIPGAVYFDIDEISDEGSPLPHMLQSPPKFSSRVRRLGLGDGVRVVVYDANRFMASARVWWMFRLFGHADVAVLDGGLVKWRAEGRPVDDLQPYLGAAGHIVVISSDGSSFGHRHAETEDDKGRPVLAMPGTEFGPELEMHARFEDPGSYRLFAQFRLGDGTVVTAPFTLHTEAAGAGH